MKTLKQTDISKDFDNKKLHIEREFDAPLDRVWKAWTDKDLLDKWWAPKPWQARTKKMDFREGGQWLYYMGGPDGEKQWCREDFKTIVNYKSFTAVDAFCDENGKENTDMPRMNWKNVFSEIESGTRVITDITFSSTAEMNKILEMGFEEGFTAALENLDELLAK